MRHALSKTLLLLALAFPLGSAHALDAAKVGAITKAAESFAALAPDSAKTGRVPREAEPAAKPLLDLVFDTSEIERGPVLPMSSLGDVNNWTMAVLKIGLVYTLAGSGVTDLSTLANQPADVIERINRNAVTFAPEMGRYFDAEIRLQGAVMDIVTVFLSTASKTELDRPNIKNGLAKIRGGNTQTIDGVLTTLPTAGLTDAWRRDRVAVITAVAPRAAKFLLPEQLDALRKSATDVAGQMTDPGVKAALAGFANALTPR
jgi:hypothetical protein